MATLPETTTVVRNELAWDSLWQRVGAPRPEVDFEREMLVVAGLALGGWDRDVSIRVDGSRTDSLVAIVHIRDEIPNLCMLDGLRAPMQVVRVARDPRPVAFRKEIEYLNCNRQDLAARRGAGCILTTRFCLWCSGKSLATHFGPVLRTGPPVRLCAPLCFDLFLGSVDTGH